MAVAAHGSATTTKLVAAEPPSIPTSNKKTLNAATVAEKQQNKRTDVQLVTTSLKVASRCSRSWVDASPGQTTAIQF